MIVVDASAVLGVLLRTPAAEAVKTHLFGEPRQTLRAPHLLDVEVAQVLRRYAATPLRRYAATPLRRYAAIGEIDEHRGSAALADLADFPIRRYPHDFLLPRVWSLRSNFTAYDAVYVTLAEALNARLLTCDRRLATAVSRHAGIRLA